MRMSWRRNVVRRRVIINLKSGLAFRGILWNQAGDLLVLRQAEILKEDRALQVDGEVIIERGEVEFIQAPIVEGR